MNKTVVLNVVGLTRQLIGPYTPNLAGFLSGSSAAAVGPVLPAVTTTVQSTYLTGAWPDEHGIVANGWYFRDECEIKFWRQSDKLVQRPRIWEKAKAADPAFTCANMFWWYAMHSAADYTVTPRPMYPADGRKLPDVWAHPGELRHWLQAEMGQFPLFSFWGPATSIRATRWIADASILLDNRANPTLTLVYLPHLDYCLQRNGPDAKPNAKDLQEIDEICGQLITHYRSRNARIIILSEYGMHAVSRPIHINRLLRQAGFITVRDELGRELLDAGESQAFAVADHQIAHVYVKDLEKVREVRWFLESTPGVSRVLDASTKPQFHMNHPRAGELVVLADPNAWFTYYYWADDDRAPDFARTVDIHRKPGYDPAELFIDPKIRWPKVKIAATLASKKLGFRTLLEVIPLEADMVRGSHGLPPVSPDRGPLVMTDQTDLLQQETLEPTEIHDLIWRHVF